MNMEEEKKIPEAEEPVEKTPAAEEAPTAEETHAEEAPETEEVEVNPLQEVLDDMQADLKAKEDQLLRLAAEFDNFRRRTQKEKEGIWGDATAAAVSALLPVYDNLERALNQETADEAYKKGVEMTMTGLKKAFEGLGVTEIDAAGQSFDPNVHNAVMHVEDENFGENTVCEVFQAGFKLGDKVIRFAMVKVAN